MVTDRVYERSEAGSVTAIFSVWNIGETIGVLDRYYSRKLITSNQFDSALSDLVGESTKMLRLNSMLLLPITSKSMVESWRLIMTHHICIADALQLFLSADNTGSNSPERRHQSYRHRTRNDDSLRKYLLYVLFLRTLQAFTTSATAGPPST